jgi:pyruvate dehydrogenase E1 component
MMSIMTALWFDFLEAEDRVSVKPHAAPVLHAIDLCLWRMLFDCWPMSVLRNSRVQ